MRRPAQAGRGLHSGRHRQAGRKSQAGRYAQARRHMEARWQAGRQAVMQAGSAGHLQYESAIVVCCITDDSRRKCRLLDQGKMLSQ
jgi:hypothetical protein